MKYVQLNIPEHYKKYYCKQYITFSHPYKLTNNSQLKKVIDATTCVNEHVNNITDRCIFNYNSLANYIRLNESKHVYVDEARQVTKPAS